MITQRISLTAQDIPKVSSDQIHELGTIAETADGRVYRYSQAGSGAALVAGKVSQGLAKVANHTDVAVAAAASAGDRQVTVTLGATAATANQYLDGYVVVVEGAGVGQTLRIEGHPAAASAGSLTLSLKDPIHTDLTTSSKVNLVYNPFASAAVRTASAAEVTTGSPVVAVAASDFFWAQTRGVASVLSDGIIAKDALAIGSASVIGALATQVNTDVVQLVGFAPEATVDTKYYPIYLTVD